MFHVNFLEIKRVGKTAGMCLMSQPVPEWKAYQNIHEQGAGWCLTTGRVSQTPGKSNIEQFNRIEP